MLGKEFNFTYFIIILFSFTSCSNVNKEDILSISISTNGRGFENTKSFALEYTKNLDVYFYGGSKMKNAGCYKSSIEKKYWDILKKKSTKVLIKFKDTILTKNEFEDNYFDIVVKSNLKKVNIIGYYSDAPKEVKSLVKFLLPKIDSLYFSKSKCHKFEVKAYLEPRK